MAGHRLAGAVGHAADMYFAPGANSHVTMAVVGSHSGPRRLAIRGGKRFSRTRLSTISTNLRARPARRDTSERGCVSLDRIRRLRLAVLERPSGYRPLRRVLADGAHGLYWRIHRRRHGWLLLSSCASHAWSLRPRHSGQYAAGVARRYRLPRAGASGGSLPPGCFRDAREHHSKSQLAYSRRRRRLVHNAPTRPDPRLVDRRIRNQGRACASAFLDAAGIFRRAYSSFGRAERGNRQSQRPRPASLSAVGHRFTRLGDDARCYWNVRYILRRRDRTDPIQSHSRSGVLLCQPDGIYRCSYRHGPEHWGAWYRAPRSLLCRPPRVGQRVAVPRNRRRFRDRTTAEFPVDFVSDCSDRNRSWRIALYRRIAGEACS